MVMKIVLQLWGKSTNRLKFDNALAISCFFPIILTCIIMYFAYLILYSESCDLYWIRVLATPGPKIVNTRFLFTSHKNQNC